MPSKKYISELLDILKKNYPDPKTELDYENEYQLAVAVMLSAQTTDKKVNQVTKKLFAECKSWEDLANADVARLQELIHGVNFHIGKGQRLQKAGQMVINDFGGNLPRTIDELVKIPGIARKSANVIMQELWGVAEGIVVDTHVRRVSTRLGLTKNTNPVKIEKDLMKQLPKESWRNYSGAVVLHGRYVCTARKPKCEECALNKICPSAFEA